MKLRILESRTEQNSDIMSERHSGPSRSTTTGWDTTQLHWALFCEEKNRNGGYCLHRLLAYAMHPTPCCSTVIDCRVTFSLLGCHNVHNVQYLLFTAHLISDAEAVQKAGIRNGREGLSIVVGARRDERSGDNRGRRTESLSLPRLGRAER